MSDIVDLAKFLTACFFVIVFFIFAAYVLEEFRYLREVQRIQAFQLDKLVKKVFKLPKDCE